MQIYHEEGAALKGDKIIAEARKITKPVLISKTGRHKALQVQLIENAFCVIQKKLRFLPKDKS